MKTTRTPKMTLPCGAEIETQHFEGSALVNIFLTNLSPGSVIKTELNPFSAKINIGLENLPDLAKLIQKYLPKKSSKRKKAR